MTSENQEGKPMKFVFKGKYGAAAPASAVVVEPSREEVDDFVKRILGVKKETM